jgi:hypothetical protein
MTSFYDVINAIKTYLEGNNSVSTVTFGDLLEVDLNKQTIFPLSHLTVRDVSFSDHVMTFTVNVMALDIVEETKENAKEQVEPFYGSNNKQDVLNTQLMVLNGLQSSLRRGGLFQQDFVVDGDLTASLVEERFENLLSGWEMNITLEVPNDSIMDINANGEGCL